MFHHPKKDPNKVVMEELVTNITMGDGDKKFQRMVQRRHDVVFKYKLWNNVPQIEIENFKRIMKAMNDFEEKQEELGSELPKSMFIDNTKNIEPVSVKTDHDIAVKIACAKRRDPQCANCHKSSMKHPKFKFKFCKRCRIVAYCGKECQKAHWKRHKKYCCNRDADYLETPYLVCCSLKYNKSFY